MKTREEFDKVYQDSVKWHCESAVIFFKTSLEKKVGFVAGKKVGGAVVRNRSKRLLRAVFIEIQPLIEDGNYIFIAKDKLVKIDYMKIKSEILWSLKRIGCLKK